MGCDAPRVATTSSSEINGVGDAAYQHFLMRTKKLTEDEVVAKVLTDLEKAKIESEARRDLVGGLISYLKDGEQDLGRLLFNYVHVDDYGQAMVEGWGELHRLFHDAWIRVGPFGLTYGEFSQRDQFMMLEVYLNQTSAEDADLDELRKRIIEASERVRIYRGGSTILTEIDHQYIDQAYAEFVKISGLSDLVAEEPDDDDDEEDEDDDGWSYEEEPDEASLT